MSELVIHAYGLCTAGCDHGRIDPAQVVLCRAWLRRWAYRRRYINRMRGSYRLKHDVESAPGGFYVTNGAFILAAILEGYRAIPCASGSPNAYFDLGIRKAPRPIVELSA